MNQFLALGYFKTTSIEFYSTNLQLIPWLQTKRILTKLFAQLQMRFHKTWLEFALDINFELRVVIDNVLDNDWMVEEVVNYEWLGKECIF